MRLLTQRGIAVVTFLLATVAPASAAQPAAIVEDVQATSAGVQQFDFVTAGEVIPLGSDGKLILGYLASCQRERIEGGWVTVGQTQSTDEGGTIRRLKVACDGGALQLTDETAQQSAVVVFRRGAEPSKDLPKPQIVLFGTSPVVKLSGPGGQLEIKRLDQSGRELNLVMTHPTEDLASMGIRLVPGALYAAQIQGRAVIFSIDAAASNGRGPVVGRLLRL